MIVLSVSASVYIYIYGSETGGNLLKSMMMEEDGRRWKKMEEDGRSWKKLEEDVGKKS